MDSFVDEGKGKGECEKARLLTDRLREIRPLTAWSVGRSAWTHSFECSVRREVVVVRSLRRLLEQRLVEVAETSQPTRRGRAAHVISGFTEQWTRCRIWYACRQDCWLPLGPVSFRRGQGVCVQAGKTVTVVLALGPLLKFGFLE